MAEHGANNLPPLVYITGASSGLGQAMAWHYYQRGWSVALVARRRALMEQWATDKQLQADRYAIYEADVEIIDSICNAGRACMEQQGLPDVVIANAGVSWGVDTSQREDLDVMQRVLACNTMGMAASFQPFIEPMIARGAGRLVGICSVAGVRGLPGHAAYSASKAAAISYCESLRTELQSSGVAVITVLPGYVDTPLTRNNPYPMPFLLSPDAFATRAYRVIEQRKRFAVIPWQMGIVSRIMRWMPAWLWDKSTAGKIRKPRYIESVTKEE